MFELPFRPCISVFSSMAAFFAKENDLGVGDLNELISDIEDELKESTSDE